MKQSKRTNLFDNFRVEEDLDNSLSAELMQEYTDISQMEQDDDESEDGGMFEHYRFVADKGQSMLRVDKYLTQHMEKTSRHRIQLAIDASYVRVNDKVVKANYKVKPNDFLAL